MRASLLLILVACRPSSDEPATWENRKERMLAFEAQDTTNFEEVAEDTGSLSGAGDTGAYEEDDTGTYEEDDTGFVDSDEVDVPWDDVEEIDAYKTYSTSYADSYATGNYSRNYGTSSSANPWTDYGSLTSGGNCTNFASQAIMAGMVRSSSASTVYSKRTDYDIDSSASSSYQWYWVSSTSRGPAFTGADKLYEYAVYNKSTYKGLHFTYVTNDTLTTFMDYGKVKVGDIIFADWEHDGTIDHSMVVTDTSVWRSGYDEIEVTYQSTGSPSSTAKYNKGLGAINEAYDYQSLFYVYRPTDYNPSGL